MDGEPETDPVSNAPLMEVRQWRTREEEEQARMDTAILHRRKFQLKVRRALMRMAFLQWRKFKLEVLAATSRVYVYRVICDFSIVPRPTHFNLLEVKKGQHVKVFETTASG